MCSYWSIRTSEENAARSLVGRTGIHGFHFYSFFLILIQILLIVLLEHLILGVKRLIDLAVPDVPEWITIEIAKQEHLRREAFKVISFSLSSIPSMTHFSRILV